MGVKGLWRLLLPIGRRISIETLEGQILAIDASIWLTQFLTVAARQREQDLLQDGSGAFGTDGGNSGKAYSYDYLVGFLRRLCKLRYQGVRPVLVFDGATPEIKQREIRNRLRRRKRKLGDSFLVLGNHHTQEDGITPEEEEALEATRRMAKRILAKQLRTGQLVTTKNKRHKKKHEPPSETASISSTIKTTTKKSANPNNNNTNDGKSQTAEIASASYAPGFYDPNATTVAVATKTHEPKVAAVASATGAKKPHDTDDDLLRDDYNTNQLQEEVNDWDKPIAVDSDEEETEYHTNSTVSSKSSRGKPKSQRPFGSFSTKNSQFHSGDGTNFQVDSVADLPESARKDVIEDARKQRRLASRREFLKVASDPDGLSSCQLANFLKSTQLNRDIVTMAQKAKRKAEDHDKLVRGNGILFEKDVDESTNSTAAAAANSNRRQHYRSVGFRSGGKRAKPGMMRLFHHKDQQQAASRKKDVQIDEDVDDEHDFRKPRNNHYLTGGLRFVHKDNDDDDDEDFLEEETNDNPLRYHNKNASITATSSQEKDGGFVVAVMDGSDQPKRKIATNAPLGDRGDDVVIEIDTSSSEIDSDGDANDLNDERKPRALASKRNGKNASQEIQDEALARALQTIEAEEAIVEEDDLESNRKMGMGEDGAGGECIEIDDSDNDSNSNPNSREEATGKIHSQRQKCDDEKLARALQEAEYEEEENHGGGFLVNEEELDHGGGFLVHRENEKSDNEKNLEYGGGFLVSEKEGITGVNGGFLVPTKNDTMDAPKSKSPPFSSSQTHEERKGDATIASKETPLSGEGWNPFASNLSDANASGSIFAMSKQRKVAQNERNNLLVCNDSSEDEDIDWEDGNEEKESIIPREKDSVQETNATGVLVRKKCKSPETTKNAIPVDDSGNATSDYTQKVANQEESDQKHQQSNKACTLNLIHATRGNTPNGGVPELTEQQENTAFHSTGKDGNNSDEIDDDEEVNWEDGDKQESENKSQAIHQSVEMNEMKPTKKIESSENMETSDDENVDWEDGDDENNQGAQEVIDVSSEAEASSHLAEVALQSAGAEQEVNDGKDDEEDDGSVEWEDGDEESKDRKSEIIDLSEEKKSDDGISNADDDEDEVDWEEGNVETEISNKEVTSLNEVRKTSDDTGAKEADIMEEAIGRKANQESSKYFNTAANTLSKTEPITLDDDSDSDDQIEWESKEPSGKQTVVDVGDWGVTKTHSSDEVAAALEHAQGTAANLTNWAGRAFRRAIAQHAMENGMEIPESAKPGVLKNTRNESDEDDPIPDPAKPDIRSPQRISQGSIQSRRNNSPGRMRSEKIDNSGWLDTVDTTNAYAEDYTVPPQEANSSDRLLDATPGGVTEEMRTEVMQLLRLFGIPYVVAPAEAEAQCVELERLGLVDGIVTEDSDTFVFGGQVIYKNIFDDKKYVEVYHAKDASEEMNLTQDSLVALAMLLGGDYTEGVKGVGIVNGMEVLQAFDVAEDCEAGLKRFRKWLDGFDPKDLTKKPNKNEENPNDAEGIRSEKEQLFHRKHHTARTRWIAPKHFPDVKVLNAYLHPVVDTSTERFSWGIPDLDGLIAFCHGHMGWVAEETEKLIAPIIQRMEEGSMRQTRIDSFMRYEDGIKFAKIQSKRLRQVLGLSSKEIADSEQSRRKRVATKKPASWNEEKEDGNTNGFSSDPEDSFSDSEELFAAVDAAARHASMVISDPSQTSRRSQQPQPKKRYHGKRTRSLAALSSASASTVAIASGSKNEDTPGSSTSGAVAARRTNHNTNLPKKAPPAYQKQSSAILEDQKDKTAESLGRSKAKTTYEVINPSMI